MVEIILSLLLFGPLVALSLVLYFYFKKKREDIDNQWRAEAQAKGATFWKGRNSDSGLNSILFKGGRRSTIEHALSYSDGTVVGEASFRFKNDFLISFDFASVPLTKYELLWLVVDSRKNNMSGRSLIDMAMVRLADKLAPLMLEGNFRDTYKVYVNPGQHIAALTALNPASMEKLIHYFDKYDTEIADSRLYIYSRASASAGTAEFRNNMINDIKALAAILR